MINKKMLISGYGWRMLTYFKTEKVSIESLSKHLEMSGEGLRKSLRNESLTLRNYVLICEYLKLDFEAFLEKLEGQDYFDYWTLVIKEPAAEYVKLVREGKEPSHK